MKSRVVVHHVFYGLHNPTRYAKYFDKLEANLRKLPYNQDVRTHYDGNTLSDQSAFIQYIHATMSGAQTDEPGKVHTASIFMDYNYRQGGGKHVLDEFDPALVALGFQRHAYFFDPNTLLASELNAFHYNYIFDGSLSDSRTQALAKYANGKVSEITGGFVAFNNYVKACVLAYAKNKRIESAPVQAAAAAMGSDTLQHQEQQPEAKSSPTRPKLKDRAKSHTQLQDHFAHDSESTDQIILLPAVSSHSSLGMLVEIDEGNIGDDDLRRIISDGTSPDSLRNASFANLRILIDIEEGIPAAQFYNSSTAQVCSMLPDAPRFAFQFAQMSEANLKREREANSHSSTRVNSSPVTASPSTTSPIGTVSVSPATRPASPQIKPAFQSALVQQKLFKQIEDAAILRDSVVKIDLNVGAAGDVVSVVTYKNR